MRKLIILGAGAPHHGKLPAALREARSGTSILQWLLDASHSHIHETLFVAGYKSEEIKQRYPELPMVVNAQWETTGSGVSLLAAGFDTKHPLLVCYSDILFRSAITESLEACCADIAIAWDSTWESRYPGRHSEELQRRERVIVNGEQVVRLGQDVAIDWASGEFIGLAYFSSRALAALEPLKANAPDSLKKRHLSEYIEYLRTLGLSVAGVDVAGDWAEFNAPQDIAHFVLGTKAETLKRLQGMMQCANIQDQEAFSLNEWQQHADALLHKIRLRFGNQLLVVRSSARSEDSFQASNAGGYDSVLNVDPQQGDALEKAIHQVIASYHQPSGDDQVLIQPMVKGVTLSGVAFTRTLEHGAPWYVINYETLGNTEAITSGASSDHHTLLLNRESIDTPLPDARLARLVKALREIETLLGYDALDIEFAIDALNTVHILQVRPIAVDRKGSDLPDHTYAEILSRAKDRWNELAQSPPHLPGNAPSLYGVMPDWNPAEIIGTAPGALAKSLYRYLIMDETWAIQRAEYGYRDVRPAPLLVEFAGRPYVDVRASFASFLPAELPNELAGRLLNFTIGWLQQHPELHDKVEFDVVPTCLAPGFERWETRLSEEGLFSQGDLTALREGLGRITTNAFHRCADDLAQINALTQRFNTLQACANLAPLERARLLLDDCKRLGTLPFAHLARSGFIAITLLNGATSIGAISREAREDFLASLRTVSHELAMDATATATGRMPWEAFVERYGHLRPGTYDITSLRYDADPERFLRPLVHHELDAKAPHTDSTGAWLKERTAFCNELERIGLPSDLDVVETFLRSAIEGREYAKFIFSRNLSAALEALAEVGSEYGLPRDDLANLPLDALLNLRTTSRSPTDMAKALEQQASQELYSRHIAAACEMPPLLTSIEELDAFILGAGQPNFIGSKSLIADCIDLTDTPSHLACDVSGKIVLIPQADPGYDWLFGQGIAGLITLFGGANSHMAIRAAEFGLPAAIGVGEQRFRELAQARVIELAPANGTLRAIQ
ncbi:MAG: PEP/pyruvate-binding domain-containing protein [Halomonas sp.]|nr:PEP/pyruvate-binding domain-containing protein [Halomonas sp.]MDP3535937.1 PEP/pyruvate-binding domain-containing protein [Halomonas sp.]